MHSSLAAHALGSQAHDDFVWWTLVMAKGYVARRTPFRAVALLYVTLIRRAPKKERHED